MAKSSELTDIWSVVEIMEPEITRDYVYSFSITGHLSITRERMVKIIKDLGFIYDKTVSYGTNYLVTNNDWNKGTTISNKLMKAQRNGTIVISEQVLHDFIMKGTPLPTHGTRT